VQTFHLRDVSTASVAALAYLIVFGSIVAFSAYSWLLQVSPAWRVGTHAYVNPLIAVALGAMVGGEPLTAALIASAVVIAGSVAIILAERTPQAASPPPRNRFTARRPAPALRETRQPGPA
jgi:drug/metabolite transporter (DMT)-like permease